MLKTISRPSKTNHSNDQLDSLELLLTPNPETGMGLEGFQTPPLADNTHD